MQRVVQQESLSPYGIRPALGCIDRPTSLICGRRISLPLSQCVEVGTTATLILFLTGGRVTNPWDFRSLSPYAAVNLVRGLNILILR